LSCLVLQWTGGRGGGHHSFEDHHAPMLTKYGAIRREKNIVLVCGSGFGDAKGSMPYLTGTANASFCDAI
jgi:fatty acid synthase subunit beta